MVLKKLYHMPKIIIIIVILFIYKKIFVYFFLGKTFFCLVVKKLNFSHLPHIVSIFQYALNQIYHPPNWIDVANILCI